MRLHYGVFLTKPYLDARSGAPFEEVGAFRAGPGTTIGIGYDRGRVGATVAFELAGLEVGEPRERDGIGMGREMALAGSFTLLGHWRLTRGLRNWQPVLSAGYARQWVGEVELAPDQMADALRHPGASGQPDSTRHSVGVAGQGARLGFGLERSLASGLALLVEGTGDLIMFGRNTLDHLETAIQEDHTISLEPGVGFSPRVALILRWTPRARSAP